MVARWKARGGGSSNKDLDFIWSHCGRQRGERVKRDFQVNHSIVEAQVSTGGASEQGPRHKLELEAQVSKRRK